MSSLWEGDGFPSGTTSSSGGSGGNSSDLHVSCRNKGIREIDLNFALMEPDAEGNADSSGMSAENAMLLASITSLDLSRNEIEHLSNLEALSALKKLDASYNLILSVHGLPFTLTRLDLSHNRLRNLDGVVRLPHLRELDVRANRLADLAGLTPHMPLQVLRADDNRLTSTLGLEDMPNLRLLSLANNFIQRLDELAFLSNAVSLQSLSLKNNPVTQVNGYRMLVGQRQAALLSLDGVPLLRPRRECDYRQGYTADSPARSGLVGADHSSTTVTPPALLLGGSWAPGVGGGGRVSSTPSVRVTPVKASTSRSSVMDGQQQQHRPQSHMPEGDSPWFDDSFMRGMRASPSDTAAAAAVEGRRVAGPDERHPYASASQAGPAGAATNVSADSGGTPVAERSAPQPTQMTGASTRTSTARPNGYARQFQEARAPTRAASYDPAGPEVRRPGEGSTVKRRGELPPSSPRAKLATAPSPAALASSSLSSALSAPARAAAAGEEMDGDRRSPAARLHDCLVAKEQLERENQTLRGQLRKSEDQLAEARRIVSEQLNQLSSTRVERDALRQSEGEGKERLERAKRHTKMMEAHHKEEVAALQEQFERAKTFYEAQLADLRRQLAAEMSRSMARDKTRKSSKEGTQNPPPRSESAPHSDPLPLAPPPPLQQPEGEPAAAATASRVVAPCVSLPPFPATPRSTRKGEEDGAERNGAGEQKVEEEVGSATPAACPPVDSSALAQQLKGWLYAQMAGDMNRAEQEDLYQRLQSSLEAEEDEEQARRRRSGKSVGAGDSLPLVSTAAARELLEAYVLQHQQQQQYQVAREMGGHGATQGSDKGGERGSPGGVLPSGSPSPAHPSRNASPERRAAAPRAVGHSPTGEPAVSRSRPSLSPQHRRLPPSSLSPP